MTSHRFFFRLTILSAMLCTCCSVLAGQATPVQKPESQPTAVSRWHFGSEVDVLPYVLGGYYGSFFVGRDEWRLRAVVARSEAPSFLVASGFEKKRSDAYALVADRFLGSGRHRQEGFWVGGGGEFWRSRIRLENTTDFTYYNNFSLTVGGGYVWKLTSHIYLNPWSAAHVIAGGSTDVDVSGKIYKQPRFTPEASLKVGFVF